VSEENQSFAKLDLFFGVLTSLIAAGIGVYLTLVGWMSQFVGLYFWCGLGGFALIVLAGIMIYYRMTLMDILAYLSLAAFWN